MSKEASAEATVRNIRRKTRRKYSAEEKIRIVLEGIRGDHTVAELYRREGISENLYYRCSKSSSPNITVNRSSIASCRSRPIRRVALILRPNAAGLR
jgi:transposase